MYIFAFNHHCRLLGSQPRLSAPPLVHEPSVHAVKSCQQPHPWPGKLPSGGHFGFQLCGYKHSHVRLCMYIYIYTYIHTYMFMD